MQASPDVVSVLDLEVLVLSCGSFMFWCSAAAAAPRNGAVGAAQWSSRAHSVCSENMRRKSVHD